MQFYKSLVITLVFCALMLLTGTAALAGTPVVKVTPKPSWITAPKPYNNKPSARNIESGYYCALVERQIDADRSADYRHIIREVISEAGIQNGSQINIRFDPAYEQLNFHQISIWRNGKPINRLNPKEFKVLADERDFSKFIYQGSYSANYIIPDVRRGDRIEYAYTITGRNPVFANRYAGYIYVEGSETLVAHQYIGLQYSAKRNIALKNFNKVPTPLVTTINGIKRYAWESFQVKPDDYESKTPDWYNTTGHVQVSEFSSWADVANWAMRINQPAGSFKGELAARIAKLKVQAKGDKEKYFREATKIVQDEVRYMGIEIGEYSHRANNPDKVFAQRYGDCKDKALLLVSMLRANDIDASMVLVNTDLLSRIDELLPTTDAFNHAVVTANINSSQVWVDATIAYQGGNGTNIYFPAYGKGLVLKAGTNGLTVIPVTRPGKITAHEKYTIAGVHDSVKLEVTTRYTGNQADDMRARLAENGIGSTEKSYFKYYSGIYSGIKEKDSLIVKDDEASNELTTIERYLVPDFMSDDSIPGKYTAGFYANLIDQQLPDVKNRAKVPLALNYPTNIDYTIEVSMANGWNVPDSHSEIKRDAYAFSSDISTAGTSLLLHYKFQYLKDYLPGDKLPELEEDIKQLRDNELGYSFSYMPGASRTAASSPSFHLNGWMLALELLVAGACVFIAIRIYKRETPAIVFEQGASFVPIGGWLTVVLIYFMILPLGLLDTIFNGFHVSIDSWNAFKGRPENTIYHTIIVLGGAGSIFTLAYAIFCLVLFLNKRDILPKAIIGFMIFLLIFQCTLYALNAEIRTNNDWSIYMLMEAVFIPAITVPYFLRSVRVAQTFIVPYPHHNFSYEMVAED